MLYQRTIIKEVSIFGIGVYSGQKICLTLKPAPADFGIQFCRIDLPGAPLLAANTHNVGGTENNTTLGKGQGAIHAVEHLISTFYGLGINNILCDLDGPEVPMMDGSSASFLSLLKEAGIKTLDKYKKFLVVLRPIKVELNDKWALIEPHHKLVIDSTIIFPHSKIKTQKKVFEFSCSNFVNHIAKARTFCLLKDMEQFKKKGLIKGGSLDNAIVLDNVNVLNQEGLRFDDEFIRHKILDTLGDLGLLGYEVLGKVTTYKSGHHLHNLLCRKLLKSQSSYKITSIQNLKQDTLKAFDLPPTMAISL